MADIAKIQRAISNAQAAGDTAAVGRLQRLLAEEQARPASQAQTGRQWGDVAGQAATNFGPSLKQYGSDILTAVTDPVGTAGTMLDLAAGGISRGVEGATGLDIFPENKATATADVVGRRYADRYGSMEGFKKALAEDPVGVLSDLSLPVTGAGGLAARVPGAVGRVGRVIQMTGDLMDPISAAGRAGAAGGRAVSSIAGYSSGMGDEPARALFNAGRGSAEEGVAARRGMREPPRTGELVDEALAKTDVLADDAQGRYRQAIDATVNSNAQINWGNVYRSIYDTLRSNMTRRGGRFKGGPTSRQMMSDVLNTVYEYTLDRNLHNLEGLDALKQELQELQHPLGANPVRGQERANRLVTSVIDGVRNEITRLEPSYSAAMEDYSQWKDLQSELRNTLSLNDKAATDTTLRKLQSTMRNNVQTNYGGRNELLDTIDSVDRGNLRPGTLRAELAGQAANTWTPRGISRAGGAFAIPAGIAALGGVLANNPAYAALVAPFIPMASPRLVGETAHAAGRVTGLLDDFAAANPEIARAARAAASPAGRQAVRQSGVIANEAEAMLEDAQGNVYDRKGRLIRRGNQ